jgi:fructose-1,6-bisphosphatase
MCAINNVDCVYELYRYGSATVMMLSMGNGVHAFVLDPDFGEFMQTKQNVRIPDPPERIYSINSGNSEMWDVPTKMFVRWTKEQAERYSSRYIGSMVPDAHRTMLRGGIFMFVQHLPCVLVNYSLFIVDVLRLPPIAPDSAIAAVKAHNKLGLVTSQPH